MQTTDRWMDGRMDGRATGWTYERIVGQTDKPYFVGPLLAEPWVHQRAIRKCFKITEIVF